MSANDLDRLRMALDAANSWAELHSDDCPHRDCAGEPGEACDDCIAESDEDPCTADVCAGAAFIELAAAARAVIASAAATSLQQATVDALQAEVARGRAKFPGGRFLLASLVEEVGELADAIMARDGDGVKCEAIQVANIATRIAEEGDRATYDPQGLIRCTSSIGAVARALLQRNDVSGHARWLGNYAHEVSEFGDPSFADITEEESQP